MKDVRTSCTDDIILDPPLHVPSTENGRESTLTRPLSLPLFNTHGVPDELRDDTRAHLFSPTHIAMDNYSPVDPLRANWVARSSSDSRPHSSLLDAFSGGGPSREESRSPEGVPSFGSNCPAVFVMPMGMPVRAPKEDVRSSTHTSGVESITRRTEEDVVLGDEDDASPVPSTFYSHKDSAFGDASDANQLIPTNSQPPNRGMVVEEHFQLAHNHKGNEDERGAERVAHTAPVLGAEEDTDRSDNSHAYQEDLHPEIPPSPLASTDGERLALPPNSGLVPTQDLPFLPVGQTQTEGRPVAQPMDTSEERLHTMLPTVELSREHPLSPSESDHPHSPRESNHFGTLREGGHPGSLSESDSASEIDHPNSPRGMHDPHSLKQVDIPRTLSESDHSHSWRGPDHPHSLVGDGQDGEEPTPSSIHPPDTSEAVVSQGTSGGGGGAGARMPTHLRPVRTLDKQSEERQFPRSSTHESPHLVPSCDAGGEEGPTVTTPHGPLSVPTGEANVPPPLISGVEADKHISTKASIAASKNITMTGVEGDHQLGPLSESMKDALHAAQEELEQAVLDRARLGGQLETVMAESQSVLTERAELQTKVAQLEAQLSMNPIGSGQTAENKRSAEIVSLKEKVASITAKYQSMHSALDRERRVTEELRSKLRVHKVISPTHSLGADQLQVARLNDKVAQLESELATLKEELTCKEEDFSKVSQKLTVQTSSSESLERTNTWLRQQLDDTMTSKAKLQAELHDAKAGSISQSIGLDQAKKEVALYQQQVSELQRALWKEKAQMVKNLEVIEADVLSKEGSYQAIMESKLELSDKCSRMEVEAAALREVIGQTEARVIELETKLADSEEDIQTVTGQLRQGEAEKAALAASSTSLKTELDKRNREITALKSQLSNLNGTLQGLDIRLRQKDVEMASAASDKEIVEKQRDAAMERQVLADAELGHAREMLAELEGRLEVLGASAQESEEGLQVVTANHKSLTLDVNQLRKALAEKELLLAQRTQQALSVEQQVSELLTQLHALQQQYGEIEASRDLTESVKKASNRAIQELEAEKESLRVHLAQREELFGKLEQEKARLEGEVDALTQQSTFTGDVSQLSKEKMHFQTELNAERVKSQHEALQLQAKIDSLESELKASKKESSKLERHLQQLNEKRSAEEVDRETQLQELREELSRVSQQAHDLAQENYVWQEATEKANSSLSLNESESERLREENREALLALQKLDTQFRELQERGQRELELLREKTEDEKRSLTSKVQQLSIEVERHRGRLAGMGHTQVTMKRHAEALEEALADRESAFTKLSRRVIDEKQVEDSHLLSRIGLLENELETKRLDVESLSSQLSGKDAEIDLLAEELSRRGDRINALQQAVEGLEATRGEASDRLVELARENDQLRMECLSLKSKLASQVSVVESYHLGIKEKGQQVDVLTKELHTFKTATEEVQTEVEKLKEYHKVAEERRQAEVESLQRMLDETLAERNNLRERLLARAQGSASSPRHHFSPLSSPSLSSIHSDTESAQKRKGLPGQEETDLFVASSTLDESAPAADLQARLEKVEAVNDSLRQSGQAAVGQVLVYHQLMRRQEEDMTKRLEEAWQHGQEVAESKRSAEIAVLKDELGYKHKSLDALRSTLSSLRRDMSKLQGQMDKHSLAARASSHSSRELECRLEDLRRSSKVPSNHGSWQGAPDTLH